ncbi:Corticotropin-releasing factor-binding protein [Acipenser ruthenus]|uniref:Corticotropin-releasing factor-binding protein n=1 Tax=Acipenser ruthenus TaxID=7906 RepID=A0A444TXQ7_ACIRT|nr:Corticotropin-releasing factor-binding protein [Acipenser ruthenus]
MESNGDTESELSALGLKVKTLEGELKACKSELHKLQKQLSQTERIYKNTESYNEDLRKQTPEGSFTMIIPHQHRNCSFSIIYPVEIKISELTLGHFNDLQVKKPVTGCGRAGDFVELLGGSGVDPSKMFPVADLCYSFNGLGEFSVLISDIHLMDQDNVTHIEGD